MRSWDSKTTNIVPMDVSLVTFFISLLGLYGLVSEGLECPSGASDALSMVAIADIYSGYCSILWLVGPRCSLSAEWYPYILNQTGREVSYDLIRCQVVLTR
ncbi:hypothetical protein BKA64DRAFT_463190 [Cadophora sp. MPI-SDFR-AT-0126]|nr:hypothetical protein BKA64DRAFT_463190 [Leotiomycetes sp. MPI-SDFR-AT-0126]